MGGELIQFRSFEEGLAVLVALAAGAVASRLFRLEIIPSILIGAVAAVLVAYMTLSEFTLENNVITYRSRFQRIDLALPNVRSVRMSTSWAALPGHSFLLVMRDPPWPTDGESFRTGLVSWPSARGWVEAVQSAIQDKAVKPQ